MTHSRSLRSVSTSLMRLNILLSFLFLSQLLFATAVPQNQLPCGLSASEASRLDVEAGTQIQAMSDFKKAIDGLLKARRFRQLDCLADSARTGKQTFPGGFWKLRAMYVALQEPPLHPTSVDWTRHLNLVQQWVALRPNSITARIALAESYSEYGWYARGEGESDSVSKSGWNLFEQRNAHAREILKQASVLNQKCPEWYFAMQMVALAQGWNAAQRQTLLQDALNAEPGYFYYYRIYAASILPKWYGAEGEVEQFLKTTADRLGGESGDILYFRVAAYLITYQNEEHLQLSWPRIQRGFKALEKRDGASVENWNYLARLATVNQDPLVANRMFKRIDNQWDEETWHTANYYQSIRDWAQQGAFVAGEQARHEDEADANLQTPEGQRYQAVIEQKLNSAVPGCVKTLGRDAGKFEILFKISQDGTSREVLTSGFSRVGFCVLKNAGEARASGPMAFPAPPKPDYWLRYDLNLDDPSSTAMK